MCKYETSWEVVSDYSEIDLTVDNHAVLQRLPAGRYRLEETHAPEGYVILTKYYYFNIAQGGSVSLSDENGTKINSHDDITLDNTGHILSVKNIPGTSLPDTGGTGTKLFSIIGIILTVFAGAVLRRRRRMGY